MAFSPTPRDIRRLASDHDFVYRAHPRPQRLGWWPFVATHLSLAAALGAGIIFLIVAVVYTSHMSKQMLECPSWAITCRMADSWTIENLGTVQGIITMIYLIGMLALAYAALGTCETAVWPLLSKQSFTIKGLDAYLSTTRGSVMSVPAAVMSVRSVAAGLVLVCAFVVTLLPFAGPPLVGHAYSPTSQPAQLESKYNPGGGIAELYAQTNPPNSVMVRALAKYNSWATDPSSEPMATYRHWYIDREVLSERGNFAAKAVSSAEVWFRAQPQLTVWVDDFEFVSDRRTRTTLVFAALNGTIEGGLQTPLMIGNLTSASSIACDVQIEAADGILSVGADLPASNTDPPILSSLATLTLSHVASPKTALNELLLWFTVAPLMASTSVEGTQPMFTNSTSTGLPVALTTTSSPDPNTHNTNTWTILGLERFIHLSIGALAQATASSHPTTSSNPSSAPVVTLVTTPLLKKLSPRRALFLLIPPLLTITILVTMAVYTVRLHASLSVPVLRALNLPELLKSSQTAWLRDIAGTDAAKTYLPSEMGRVKVRYGVDGEGIAGFVDGSSSGTGDGEEVKGKGNFGFGVRKSGSGGVGKVRFGDQV
ncbi:hypothetical protein VTI74DRAFT_6139 [Chaetomium olivicolor]